MKRMHTLLHGVLRTGSALGLSCLLLSPSGVRAADPAPSDAPAKVSFYKQIRPIFQANCQGCHQPARRGGEYLMTAFDRLLKGGESGKNAVVPGKPDASYLIEEITPKNGKAEMPEGRKPLAAAEIALVRKWIEEGAADDTPAASHRPFDAERPPVYSRPPVVTSMDYSPDGKYLAVAGFHEALLVSTADWKLAARLVGLSPRIETVRFSPKGDQLLVVGGTPGQVGEVQIWDVEKRSLVLAQPATFDAVYGGSWSPDGTKVAFGCADNTVRAIDAKTGEQVLYLGAHSDWVRDTAFSVDGSHLATVGRDMSAKLTEVATQRFVDNITSITPGALKGGIQAVARHPQRDEIVLGGSDGVVKVYRMHRLTKRVIGDDANLIREMPEMKGRIFGVAVSRDGKRLAAVSSLDGAGQVRVFSYEFDTKLPDPIKGINEKVASSRSKEEKEKLEAYHKEGVKQIAAADVAGASLYAVAFAPDSATLAVSGADGQVRILKTETGEVVTTFSPAPVQSAGPENVAGAARPVLVKKESEELRESPLEGKTFTRIEVLPTELKLTGRFEKAQLVVQGITPEGEVLDVTRQAKYTLDSAVVDVSVSGYVQPKVDGEGKLSIAAYGHTLTVPVQTSGLAASNKVDFIRDVNPVLSRLGCNQGTCHGAQAGKNGFKLSLRGYDPLYDLRALADDLAGRRINFASPDDSLMLQKPIGVAPHAGGVVLNTSEPNYEIIRSWIADGSKLDLSASRVTKIEVQPADPVIQKIGGRQQLRVLATYTSGAVRDVTREAFLESGNTEAATVSTTGLATSLRRGEAPILARYEGAYAAATLTVMGDRNGFEWKDQPTYNRIDELTAAKWKRMKILPSEVCTDAEFLRRVHLDLTGLPPTVEQVKKFLDDPRDPRVKRDEVVDQLVGSKDFVEFWTNKWADLLQVNRKYLGPEGSADYRKWIRKQIEDNVPYDQFAREIVTAKGSNKDNPAASYFKVLRTPQDTLENTTHLFLAIRFNCNKCHDHPFERWTQDQYYQTAAYFAQVDLKADPQSNGRNIGGSAVEGAKPFYEIVEDTNKSEVLHDRTREPTAPKFPFECQSAPPEKATRREALAAWLTSADNPYFARSYANRLWGYLLGAGIIEPIDDIRAGNPPTNPELLAYLTEEFKGSKFDVRHMLKLICKSRTYQLSVGVNDWNKDDKINFSHALARRLPAEVLFDSIHRVTGTVSRIPGAAPGTRAAELPDSGVDLKSGFLSTFGRPPRESACECERTNSLQLGPVMDLISGPTLADAIADGANGVTKAVSSQSDDRKLIEELFLAVLNRPATDAEIQATLEVVKSLDQEHEKLAAEVKARADVVAAALPALESRRNEAIAKTKAELEAHEKAIAPKVAELEKARIERIAKAEEDLKKYEGGVAQKQKEWEATQSAGAWTILTPAEVKSTNKSVFTTEKDLSVFVTGDNGKGVITFEAVTELQGLTGLRLELLPDDRLPMKGPGRAGDGNFVVNEVDVEASPAADSKKKTKVDLTRPKADFVQQGFDVKQLVDDVKNNTNGWAVAGAVGVVHWVTFEFKQPLKIEGDGKTRLRVSIHSQFNNAGYLPGRFRVSVTNAPRPIGLTLPEPLREGLELDADKRSPELAKTIDEYFRVFDAGYRQRTANLAKAKEPVPTDPKLVELREKFEVASKPIPPDGPLVQLQSDLTQSEAQRNNRRLTVAQDLVWVLINSTEFLFNH